MNIKLLVGLGNPGDTYTNHRHNVGFRWIDTFINKTDHTKAKKKCNALLNQVNLATTTIHCAKPQTYMNESGISVQKLIKNLNTSPQEICIIYDDFDLPFGTSRFRQSGSAGTHNGMRSIIQQLGTNDIPRLRIGIGPKPASINTAEFVLTPFTKDESTQLTYNLSKTTNIFKEYINASIEILSTELNRPPSN